MSSSCTGSRFEVFSAVPLGPLEKLIMALESEFDPAFQKFKITACEWK
ncbi:MAG: hypothetical protein M3250_08650 [Thermoproteota archaeon]|nr:hypothetical protein [Thermoproteota archaeon]